MTKSISKLDDADIDKLESQLSGLMSDWDGDRFTCEFCRAFRYTAEQPIMHTAGCGGKQLISILTEIQDTRKI